MWERRLMVSWAASGGALPAGGRRQSFPSMLGRPLQSLQILKKMKPGSFQSHPETRQGATGTNRSTRNSSWTLGSTSTLCEWWSTVPERLWNLLPWRHSTAIQTWIKTSSSKCLCLWRGRLNQIHHKSLFQTKSFCDLSCWMGSSQGSISLFLSFWYFRSTNTAHHFYHQLPDGGAHVAADTSLLQTVQLTKTVISWSKLLRYPFCGFILWLSWSIDWLVLRGEFLPKKLDKEDLYDSAMSSLKFLQMTQLWLTFSAWTSYLRLQHVSWLSLLLTLEEAERHTSWLFINITEPWTPRKMCLVLK